MKYIYNGSIEELKSVLNDSVQRFNIDNPEKYTQMQVYIKNDKLEVGLERSGHDNGYWFNAIMLEMNNQIVIEGSIIEEKPTKWYEWTVVIVLWIIFLPIALLIRLIFNDWPKNRVKKLDRFMVEYLKCSKQ
ncbi:MAG: hypothetical protein KKH01_00800 [Firmicutes bacterium]|nr:hypothetical protein [Bacillota bacterium]